VPRLDVDLALLVINVGITLLFLKAYRDRAKFRLLGERLSSFFAPQKEQETGHPLGWLFLVSFAGLYTEVMMIRWIGTEVRIFAYFQNLALIACFLGFGLGCYRAKHQKSILFSLFAMTALILLVQSQSSFGLWKGLLNSLTNLLSLSPDAALWGFSGTAVLGGETAFLLRWSSILVLASLLCLLVLVMIPLGQWVGFYLDAAPNAISAYSVNLLGSVAGIWAFAGLAFFWLPPRYWFCLAFLLLAIIGVRSRRLIILSLVLLAGGLVLFRQPRAQDTKTYWSPYQKLEVADRGEGQYDVAVNNTGYMTIANVTTGYLALHPETADRYRASSYDAPFRFARSRDAVLIVGAGAGNDAAAALRNGAGTVDAVEIDPVIYSLGQSLHPEKPYSSARVRKIRNDARAFLRQTNRRYDVVLFALLDSHTEFSDFSNMRIDNYVYTEEALREARRLLKPGGILILKFEVRAPWTWMGQRLYRMLDAVFGRAPIVFYAPQIGALLSGTVFVTSDDPGLWTRVSEPALAHLVAENPPKFPLNFRGAPGGTTDDWPYVYHRSHSIPRAYLVVSLILLGMAVLLVRGSLEANRTSTWHFLLLGAGFLLLETQLVSRLALYFGTTWFVNCVALTAILLMLVAANLYVAHFRPNRPAPYYLLLVLSLLANYIVPWDRLPYGAQTVGILLSAAYSVSLFFAGVIFTELFGRTERKSSAFGANIVGAVAGGLAQNVSFILGMKMLLLVAVLFYALAGYCEFLVTSPQMVGRAFSLPPTEP
jgi:spermidine synthase